MAGVTLNSLAACGSFSSLGFIGGGLNALVARDNRIVTEAELDEALRAGPINSIGLPFGFFPVFMRGDAQTNTVVRLNQSLFAKFTDIRSSMGAEVRFQIPILNVPFRLIYAYNPNARKDQVIDGFPFFFSQSEKKSVFRFSVGRTF